MNDDSGDEDRAAILARRQRFIALAIGGLATGCGPPGAVSDGGTTTMASSTTGSSTTTETGATTEPGTGTETETDSGTDSTTLGFVPTGPRPCLSQCDTFAQDCPDGEKCVPYASTGGTWDANKCVPIQGDNAPGEPCVYAGAAEATDDCEEWAYCWDVQDVDGTLTGVCTPFCAGTADDWICDEGTACLIANDSSITLCVAECDPLVQDCGAGLGCSWTGQTFGCLVTTAGELAGEPCGYANDCAPGSVCAMAEASPACAGPACCVDYCAVDDLASCLDPQLECVSSFADGQAPAGLETLGLCVPPGACDGGEPGCFEHLPTLPVDG